MISGSSWRSAVGQRLTPRNNFLYFRAVARLHTVLNPHYKIHKIVNLGGKKRLILTLGPPYPSICEIKFIGEKNLSILHIFRPVAAQGHKCVTVSAINCKFDLH